MNVVEGEAAACHSDADVQHDPRFADLRLAGKQRETFDDVARHGIVWRLEDRGAQNICGRADFLGLSVEVVINKVIIIEAVIIPGVAVRIRPRRFRAWLQRRFIVQLRVIFQFGRLFVQLRIVLQFRINGLSRPSGRFSRLGLRHPFRGPLRELTTS